MTLAIELKDTDALVLMTEASAHNRTPAEQAEHWMRIGRAVEEVPTFNYENVRLALAGKMSADALSAEEQEVFFDEFSEMMWTPSEESKAFFADRRAKGLGVGLDENDNLVYQKPEAN